MEFLGKHGAVHLLEAPGGGRVALSAKYQGRVMTSAVELGGHGITVNAVCPNHVTTGLGAEQNEYFARFKGLTVAAYLDDMKKRIPLGRPGLTEDTANTVAFLCSDEAQYITGEAMNVSGGEEMH